MIAESPRILLMFLLATTLLGAIMGFCIALLRAKTRAREAIASARVELSKEADETKLNLEAARENIESLRSEISLHQERADKSLQREEAIELHSQLQAQRISTLEAQLASYEDQQIRLQRDFASYKSNKSRELELARNNSDSLSMSDSLPILSKRIDDEAAEEMATGNAMGESQRQNASHGKKSRPAGNRISDGDRLSKPLSRELDIPSLSESELPDSVDGLEFELVDMDGTGAWPRG